jgi:hypothetical protein
MVQKMKLRGEVAEEPHVVGNQVTTSIVVMDVDTGQQWTVESNLSGAASKMGGLPFDVVKAAEDILQTYLAQEGATAKLRLLRDEVARHRLGVTYRPKAL